MFKKIASLTATLALALTVGTPAFAYTTPQTLSTASLTVLPVCTINNFSNFTFTSIGAGSISGSIHSAPQTNANISYTCTGSANYLELSDLNTTYGNDFVLTNGLSTLPFQIWASLNGLPGLQINNGGLAGQGALDLTGGLSNAQNSIGLQATVDSTLNPIAVEGQYLDTIYATLNFS